MATAKEFTKIVSLEVNGQSVKAVIESYNNVNPNFEIMLDGWAKWKPASNPVLLNDLNPGVRTLSVRSYNKRGGVDVSPATKQFTIVGSTEPNPDPDPSPEFNWQTQKVLTKISDWSGGKLISGLDGATITEVGNGIRYFVPGPQSGERCETQTYFGEEGQRCAYDYSFNMPASTKLSNAYPNKPWNIISQHHGNNQAGYTGGVSVYPNGDISLRVKGGHELSMSGSHPYEYESELPFGSFQRDVWNHVRLEILWKRDKTGSARARLNNGNWATVSNVPTWPLGDSDNDPTDNIMYRHGFYPQGGTVQGNMEITFSPLTLQLAV